ncbi:hypothetical protein GCM10023166_01180 [Paeniglutamicibacter cryotolerans]
MACLLAVPLLAAVMDMLRMWSEGDGAITGGIGEPEAGARALASVAACPGPMAAATILAFATAFVAIPALPAIWRLTRPGLPVLAVVLAAVGSCFVLGRVIHTCVYFTWTLFMATRLPLEQAVGIDSEMNGFWPVNMVIVPTILGLVLWLPLLAVALYRAGRIPLWAMILILVVNVALIVLGSSYATAVAMGLGTLIGLLPLARGALDPSPAASPDRRAPARPSLP